MPQRGDRASSRSMKLHLAQLPKLIAERRSTAIFGVVIIAMLWSGICLKYVQDVRGDERDAERTNQNFAMVFEENVLRSIGEIDKSLLYLRRTIETRQDTDRLPHHRQHRGPAERDHRPGRDHRRQGHHAGVQCRSATRARCRPERPRALSRPPQQRGRPSVHQSGRWSAASASNGRFSSRAASSTAKDEFGGVVVTSLNPAHLTDFYNRIDFGYSTSIALIGQDGVVRSSGGAAGGLELGQDLSKTTMFQPRSVRPTQPSTTSIRRPARPGW